MMVLCCDPLAIALTAAPRHSAQSQSDYRALGAAREVQEAVHARSADVLITVSYAKPASNSTMEIIPLIFIASCERPCPAYCLPGGADRMAYNDGPIAAARREVAACAAAHAAQPVESPREYGSGALATVGGVPIASAI